MSAQPLSESQATQGRPKLTLVPTRAPVVSNLGFIGIIVGLLLVGLLAVMVVTTQVAIQSRELSELRQESTLLSYEVASLNAELQSKSSSSSLALRATDLGMLPNPYPAFIRLSDYEILGDPKAVPGQTPDFTVQTAEAD